MDDMHHRQGFTLQDDVLIANIVAASAAEALTLFLRGVNETPAGDVRLWNRKSSTDNPKQCRVFRLRAEKCPRETWPLAQSRTDPRSWHDWDFIGWETRSIDYASRSQR